MYEVGRAGGRGRRERPVAVQPSRRGVLEARGSRQKSARKNRSKPEVWSFTDRVARPRLSGRTFGARNSPDIFVNSLSEFINWKTQKGFNIIVAYTNEIGSSSNAIKNYLQNQYNNPPNDASAPSLADDPPASSPPAPSPHPPPPAN